MGKVMNTKWFIDKNSQIINDLYQDRLGRLQDLTIADLNRSEVVKGLTELRLYRLPPYFKIETQLKGRIQTQSSTCYGLEEVHKANEIERELMSLHSVLWQVKGRHDPCSKCGTRRASKDGVCWKCADGDDRALSKAYNANILTRRPALTWVSPKKILLAATVGCTHCFTKLVIGSEEIWYGDLAADWGDGLCPECLPRYPLGHEWSLPSELRRNSPSESYDICQVCHKSDMSYAIWGMCSGCYQNWQDGFVDPDALYPFVEQWGAIAALLIRPSIEWLNYLKSALEHKYCWNPVNKSFPKNAVLEPFVVGNVQVRLNIKEMVHDSVCAGTCEEEN